MGVAGWCQHHRPQIEEPMRQLSFDEAKPVVTLRQLRWLVTYLRSGSPEHVISPSALEELRSLATEACELVHDTFTDEVPHAS